MENIERSLNFELIEGATDAVVKKGSPDRGGRVEAQPTRAFLRNNTTSFGADDREALAHEVIRGVVRGT